MSDDADGPPDDGQADELEGHVEAGDAETFDEHPINPQTMRVLLIAVVLVAAIVLAGVVLARARRAEPTTARTTPTVTTQPATTTTPAATTTPATTAAAIDAPELPPRPYQVAEVLGPKDLEVYATTDATVPMRTLPARVVVGVERTATVAVVMLVKSRPRDGWLEVHLPMRPNGSTGFIRADDVTVTTHQFRIEVSLGAFRLQAFLGDRVLLDAPIAVAAEATPTPGGLYYTNTLLRPPDPTGPYGTYAYGLSGYSDTLTEFAGGEGQLGIHGTNEPELMGQQVSHGCIRLRNEDIDRLAAVLPLGVPVVVNP